MNLQQPFYAIWIFSGTTWVNQYQKKHSPAHMYPDPLSASSIYCDSRHPPCSIYVPVNENLAKMVLNSHC